MTCPHSTIKWTQVIVNHDIDYEPVWENVKEVVDTTEDVDLHRYKCTQCGELFYYSERARLFFEQGIETEAYGLTVFNLIKYGGVIPKNY
jgi:hypothetical protein